MRQQRLPTAHATACCTRQSVDSARGPRRRSGIFDIQALRLILIDT